MSGAWFGTDGIRAPFGTPPLVEPIVHRLGRLLAAELTAAASTGAPPPLVVLGGDTRSSTATIASWLTTGLRGRPGDAARCEVAFAGVVPTPAVARLVGELGAAAGIAVSASHNLPPDNGIKLIAADGFKWPSAGERALEAALRAGVDADDQRGASSPPGPSAEPTATLDPAAVDPSRNDLGARYLERLLATLSPQRPLAGLSLAVDCANGAASPWAAELFRRAGASVRTLHDQPDGGNINRGCGSTHPESLQALVRESGVDLGIAFDGDADRALLVDHRGELVDGDGLLYLWARALADRGELPARRIVATSMSNLGLEVALRQHSIGVERCDVGDRVVVETLRSQGLRLGGEQSGHIVDLALSTTGDGLLTALQLAAIVARNGRPLAELVAGYRRFPQLLRNLRVPRKPPLDSLPTLAGVARTVGDRLGAEGRLVLRYSGTEPLFRIMLEGPDQATIEEMADQLAAAMATDLGLEQIASAGPLGSLPAGDP